MDFTEADTGGAVIGLLIALYVVWVTQANQTGLKLGTFQTVVLASLIPGFLAVLSLAVGAEEVSGEEKKDRPEITFRGLGKSFLVFMLIVGLFDLGNSSDAFLVLRAQEWRLSILGFLGMLVTFNLVYTLISTPGGPSRIGLAGGK